MKTHTHTCANPACKYSWLCDGVEKENGEKQEGDICGIDVSANANKQGPWCEMCRHLIMANRYAKLRRINLNKFTVPE